VREPEAYVRARRIAKETLDGRLWLSDIGKATHYHACWVHPRWVREMHRIDRIGVHTFYRPRGWGSGADAPSWGSAQETAAIAATL
jgi:spore germination cell wall hydrolase CwlJ-like protein